MPLGQATLEAAGSAGPWDGLFLLFIGVIVVLIRSSIDFVLALSSGWRSLAMVYRSESPPPGGRAFYSYDTMLLKFHAKECDLARLTTRGVYLTAATRRFFFHPPLLLPWTYFEEMEVQSDGFSQLVKLHFEDPAGRSMTVPLPSAAIATIRELTGRNDFSGEVLR